MTLADVKPCEMQQCIGLLDRRLHAPIGHEAPSHRHLGSSEITVVLGRKSARKLIPAVILYSPRPRFDHLTGGVQTAGICRSQSKSASNPTREQRHQRNKLTHHLDRRLELLPCLRRFIEQIAGCTKAFRGTPPPRPVSCTNASRENETVLPKSPMHNRYDARRSSRPRRPRLSRSSRVAATGASLGGLQARQNLLERLGPEADRIAVGRIQRHSGKATLPRLCAPPHHRSVDFRDPAGARISASLTPGATDSLATSASRRIRSRGSGA